MNIPQWNISQVLGAIIGGLLGLVISSLLIIALLFVFGPILVHIVSFLIGGAAIGWFIGQGSAKNVSMFSGALIGVIAGLGSMYLSLASGGDFTVPVPFYVMIGVIILSIWFGGQFGAEFGEKLGWKSPAIAISKQKAIGLQIAVGLVALSIIIIAMGYLFRPKLLQPDPCSWWDGIVKRTGCLAIIKTDKRVICRFELASSGDILAVTEMNSNSITLWEGQRSRLLSSIESTSCNIDIAFTSTLEGTVAAIPWGDDQVRLWRAEDGELLQEIQTENCSASTCRLAFSRDGELLATVDFFRGRLWQVRDGALLQTFWDRTTAVKGSVETVAFSPDGEFLAMGTSVGRVYFWRVAKGRLLDSFLQISNRHDSVEALAYSPDGRLLVARTSEGLMQPWEVNTAKLVHSLNSDSPFIRW